MKRILYLAFLVAALCTCALSQQLQLTGLDGKTVALSGADLKSMPHHLVTVVNAHNKSTERYDGVLLSDLLTKIDAPAGGKVHGPALLMYVKVGASDDYHVLFSLAEIDQFTHKNEIIVADHMNGKPLDDKTGPLKLVVPQDTHPSRSIRMLKTISLHQAQ